MGIVGRKGKLSITGDVADIQALAWERYEDVLTADVFGAFRYLPACFGIVPMLEKSRDENGKTFPAFLERFGIVLSTLDIARIRFWPTFSDGREPDVFVLLESSATAQSVALLVEAKLNAPQHKIPTPAGDVSQLGHYLTRHLVAEYSEQSIPWPIAKGPRPLLFITNHDQLPAEQLERARSEACRSHQSIKGHEIGLFWTNWATIGESANELWRRHRAAVDREPWLRLLLDLRQEFKDRDLLARPRFNGMEAARFVLPSSGYRRSYEAAGSSLPGRSRDIALRRYSNAAMDVDRLQSRYSRGEYFVEFKSLRPLISGDSQQGGN